MTGLHWACKKNNFPMARLLMDYNSDVDAKDIVILIIKDRKNTHVFCFITEIYQISLFAICQ